MSGLCCLFYLFNFHVAPSLRLLTTYHDSFSLTMIILWFHHKEWVGRFYIGVSPDILKIITPIFLIYIL